jgi:hypothetical protein
VLLDFKESGNGEGLDSWQNGTDPCGSTPWAHVYCDAHGAVIHLGYEGEFPDALTGRVGALAPLRTLTYLGLGDGVHQTAVGGALRDLAPLTQLTDLYLWGTAVGGALRDLAPLTKLDTLELSATAVVGNAAADLGPLTKLEYLSLTACPHVTGCDAFCAAHPNLYSCCCGPQVFGCH